MAEDPRLQLPDGAVRLTCETPRGELAVTCIGMDNTPHRWFLFVPGYLASKEDFYALMSVLADAGCGAVAFDPRGHYESEGSPRLDWNSLQSQALDTSAVADLVRATFASDPGVLVGHSAGGLTAQQAVALRQWHAMVLLCSGQGALPAHRHGALPLIRRYVAAVDRAYLWDRKLGLERAAGTPQSQGPAADFERQRWLLHHVTALETGAQSLMETATIAPPAQHPAIHVVWGENDDNWPASEQHLLSETWSASRWVIPHVGHNPQSEAPDALARLLMDISDEK